MQTTHIGRYGPGIDEPICMIDAAGGNAIYYYHYDGLGSVAALSNTSGDIVERYEYDVFGKCTVHTSAGADGVWMTADDTTGSQSAVGNPYMFTGRRYDAETGLYYYRARYYHPTIGRFLQTDPVGYEAGLNLYTYVLNNPVHMTDPYGLCFSVNYSVNSVKYSIKTTFCPPFTEAIAKSEVNKLLKKYKKGNFDSCPAGQSCTGGSVTSKSGSFDATVTRDFWWFPWVGPKPGPITWIHCVVTATGTIDVTVTFRTGGNCCPE